MLIAPPGAAQSPPKVGQIKCNYIRAEALREFAEDVWRPIRWERGAPKKSTRRAFQRKLRCTGPGHRKAGRRSWAKAKRAYNRYRLAKYAERKVQRERLRYLPFDCGGGVRSAIRCDIMLCESGGSYTARNGSSTAGGKYQIIDSTFYAYGGRPNGDSHPAAAAPPAEQDRVAAAIWSGGAGRSHWVC